MSPLPCYSFLLLLLLTADCLKRSDKIRNKRQYIDDEFSRSFPDLTATVLDADGKNIPLRAWHANENRKLLLDIPSNPDKTNLLRFMSVGSPKIVFPTNDQIGTAEQWKIAAFVPDPNGFHFYVQMLTPAYREALAWEANDIYQTPINISDSQIVMLTPDSFTCDVEFIERGVAFATVACKVNTFGTEPLKVECQLNQTIAVYKKLGNITSYYTVIDCSIRKRLYGNQLVITAQKLNQMNFKTKLFGTANSVFVSKSQLYHLCRDIMTELNVFHYEIVPPHDDGFVTNFVSDFLTKLGVQNKFKLMPIAEALPNLSSFNIYSNLSPDDFVRDYSDVLTVTTVGDKQLIVRKENSTQLKREGNRIGGGRGFSTIEAANYAAIKSERWANSNITIDDQLSEINNHSQSDIKFKREGMRIVPEYLVVAQIYRWQMPTQSLIFSRFRRYLYPDFHEEFSLDLPYTAAEYEIRSVATTSTATSTTTTYVSTTTTPTTTTTTTDPCNVYQHNSCQRSTDCCGWNTPEFKLVQTCGDSNYCGCIGPGNTCNGGFRCCDGSICNEKCPPAAKFHFCNTFYRPNCQSGLNCTVDSVSTLIWGRETSIYGRCL